MAKPIADSAAAIVQMKITNVCPIISSRYIVPQNLNLRLIVKFQLTLKLYLINFYYFSIRIKNFCN